MRKILIGCINNNLRNSKTIKTRFFQLDNGDIKDITESICIAVNVNRISSFKHVKGLAVYSFGCGLSHHLQNDNLNLIGLKDYKIEMFTLEDVKKILNCNGVFDINITEKLKEYYNV